MSNTIELRWAHDEECEVFFNDVFIMSVNHYVHGWEGMSTVLNGFKAMARAGSFPVIVTGEPGV